MVLLKNFTVPDPNTDTNTTTTTTSTSEDHDEQYLSHLNELEKLAKASIQSVYYFCNDEKDELRARLRNLYSTNTLGKSRTIKLFSSLKAIVKRTKPNYEKFVRRDGVFVRYKDFIRNNEKKIKHSRSIKKILNEAIMALEYGVGIGSDYIPPLLNNGCDSLSPIHSPINSPQTPLHDSAPPSPIHSYINSPPTPLRGPVSPSYTPLTPEHYISSPDYYYSYDHEDVPRTRDVPSPWFRERKWYDVSYTPETQEVEKLTTDLALEFKPIYCKCNNIRCCPLLDKMIELYIETTKSNMFPLWYKIKERLYKERSKLDPDNKLVVLDCGKDSGDILDVYPEQIDILNFVHELLYYLPLSQEDLRVGVTYDVWKHMDRSTQKEVVDGICSIKYGDYKIKHLLKYLQDVWNHKYLTDENKNEIIEMTVDHIKKSSAAINYIAVMDTFRIFNDYCVFNINLSK